MNNPQASSQALNGRIMGIVLDRTNGPVPEVSVTLRQTGQGMSAATKTGPDGRFVFDRLDAGGYAVDFDLLAFDVRRHNNVRLSPTIAQVDLKTQLSVSGICECISYPALPTQKGAAVSGVIRDQAGRPVPHAGLEILGSARRATAWSGLNGEFEATLPVGSTCELVVRDTAFERTSVALRVSEKNPPIPIALVSKVSTALPDIEDFPRPCRCGSDVFLHAGR